MWALPENSEKFSNGFLPCKFQKVFKNQSFWGYRQSTRVYVLGAKDYVFSIVLMIPIFLSPFLYLVMRVLMDVQMYVPASCLYHLS